MTAALDITNKKKIIQKTFKAFNSLNIHKIPQIAFMDSLDILRLRATAAVLPFRVNSYVLENLIDWNNIPADPIYQMIFPQPGMIDESDLSPLMSLIDGDSDRQEVKRIVDEIREKLYPHPAQQMTLNIPEIDGYDGKGLQHKYRETVLFFPAQGQTCHSYCSFCFRWPQFTGDKSLKFSDSSRDFLYSYLLNNSCVSNLVVTGGDPFVMKTSYLQYYLEGLCASSFKNLQSIRIGTKSLTYWPFRFISDPDAQALLDLLKKLVRAGKHITVMAHYNHVKELQNQHSLDAIERLQSVGVVVRSQGPVLCHVNDSSDDWINLWNTQERLGIIPYYMFVERKTGAYRYYEIPLSRAYDIYKKAISHTSGLARTARGPSMSATQGKVEIQGVSTIGDKKVFVLRYIQARNTDWVQQPFFSHYDPKAMWFDELKPFSNNDRKYFEKA